MCPQTPADQHNSPVLSHLETYGPVPLHHRSSSLAAFHPFSASKRSAPPAAASFPQAAGNLLQSCAICDLPPPEKLSTPFFVQEEALPLGAAPSSQAAVPNISVEQTALFLPKVLLSSYHLPGASWFNTNPG